MLPCGLIHCIKHTLGENILLFKLLLLKRYNVGVRHVFSSHLRSELQCWPGNQCGFILVNKAFTESTHTSMGHLSLPVWHKYTVYWSIMKMNFYEGMAVRVNITTVSCFSKWSVMGGGGGAEWGKSVSVCVCVCCEWEALWIAACKHFITPLHCKNCSS